MSAKKTILPIIIIVSALLFLTGCGSKATPELPTMTPIATKLPTVAPTSTPAPKPGYISGHVRLVSPPTPHMVVYAVNSSGTRWAFTETEASDGEASYILGVPPGSYQLFAFSDLDGYAGYSLDGTSLAPVTVGENQTVPNINLQAPGQSACGSMFGVPASPDKRFKAARGPGADCLATIKKSNDSSPSFSNAVRVNFESGSTNWQINNNLAPRSNASYVLYALQGQQMTVYLNTKPAAASSPLANLYIAADDGTLLSGGPTISWSGLLTANQDYYIGINSLSDQTLEYTLNVYIPATTTTLPTATPAHQYVPVPLSTCKEIQAKADYVLNVKSGMEYNTFFNDPITNETGSGCTLTSKGTGEKFISPSNVTGQISKALTGWEEKSDYRASGPTGEMIALSRDTTILIVKAEWKPAQQSLCASNRSISSCNLTNDQKIYTIQIQAAMK
jgi:hypothetical protein